MPVGGELEMVDGTTLKPPTRWRDAIRLFSEQTEAAFAACLKIHPLVPHLTNVFLLIKNGIVEVHPHEKDKKRVVFSQKLNSFCT